MGDVGGVGEEKRVGDGCGGGGCFCVSERKIGNKCNQPGLGVT